MRPGSALSLLFLLATSGSALASDGFTEPIVAALEVEPAVLQPAAASGDSTAAREERGSGLGRAGKLVRNFGSDLWYIVSSPARVNRKGALYTLGILGTTGILYAYDEEIARAFHRSKGNPWYDAVIDVGDAIEPVGHMGKTNPYYVGGAVISTAFKIAPMQRLTYEILESHLISGGIRNTAKLLIGRRREHEGRGARFFEFNGGTSFPSGHSSVIFELATILSHYTKRPPATCLYYGLASTLALQRIDDTQHWPSDVFLSAVQGTLVARVVIHRNEERRGHDVPVISFAPYGNGVMVTYRF
jgi:hypothetical protein